MYKICATKRDLDTIDRKLYQFIPDLWEVVTPIGTYQLKYEDTQYNLYSNGEKTSLFVTSISLIRDCVYEGQQITVNLADNSSKIYIGTLKRIAQDGEKAVSKSGVFSDSLCSLKSPSKEYVDNRLVREEDIIRPEQVSVYFDPRYLSIDHVKTNGIEIVPISFIPEYIERLPGDAMSSEVQKTQACKAVTCSKGDRVVVTKKEGVEYDIVITKVTDYSSLETILLNHDDVLEFDVNQTVFIEFQIPIETYTLYAHCGEIHTETASLTVNATVNGKTAQLVRGACDSSGNYSVTTSQIQVKPGQIVQIEVEADCEIGSPLVYSPSIRNLITNLEIEPITISSDSQTWTGSFIMPKADCLLSPKVKYILHDGGQEDINPLFYLTVKSSDLASVVVNNTEYDLTNGPVTMLCDVADVSWELLDGYLSKVDIYPTQNPSAVFHSEVGFITHKAYVLSCDTTIEISIQQVDCKYKSFRGKIDSLDKGKKWNSSNSILNVSGNVPQKTYYVDTNVQIGDSGEPSHFEGTEVEEVVFYNPANSFYIHPKAFKKCEYLKSIDLSKSSDIRVKEEAFWGSFSLSDFKNTQAISELGEYSFTNTDLPSFTYGHDLLQIPDYTFMNCRDLADVDYESSSSLESVGKLAFDNCRKLKHAVFPKSLSKIGDQCFGENAFSDVHTSPAYCTRTITDSASCVFNVDSLEFKNGMTELPEYAFEFCNNIKEVYLPASIDLIKKGAFLACNNIKHFASPGVKIIRQSAFGDTWIEGIKSSDLVEVTGIAGPKLYQLLDTRGILFSRHNDDSNTFITYLAADFENYNNLILYKLNSEYIKNSTKPGQDLLVDVHPNTLSISDWAFSKGPKRGSVTHVDCSKANKLFYIGDNAFHTSYLTNFTLPDSGEIQLIDKSAFQYCFYLENLNINNNCFPKIKKIADYAFADCHRLTPPLFDVLKVEEIGDYAFYKAFRRAYDEWEIARKQSIWCMLGASIAYVGMLCLGGWAAGAINQMVINTGRVLIELSEVAIDVGLGLGGVGASGGFGAVLDWARGLPYKSYEKKYGSDSPVLDLDMFYGAVTSGIGIRANRGIFDIMFPDTLTSIGKYAFAECPDIRGIIFKSPIEYIPEGCFAQCSYLCTVMFARDIQTEAGMQLTESTDYLTVKEVGKYAFYETDITASTVNKIIFNATSVGERAFSRCFQLTANCGTMNCPHDGNINENKYLRYRIVIPPQLKTIDKYAFGGANIVQFTSTDPLSIDIHPNAFSFDYSDGYNEYLYAADKIALVPDGYEEQYKTLFTDEQGYQTFNRMFTYDNVGNIVKVINEW